MNQTITPDSIDRDIELRLTAMLLGEASDFERSQLHQLLLQRPELAAWFERNRVLHQTLGIIGLAEIPTDLPGDDDSWKLPAERRSALLDVLDGKAVNPGTHSAMGTLSPRELAATNQPASSKRKKWTIRELVVLASAASFLCFICSLLFIPAVQSARESKRAVASLQVTVEESSEPRDENFYFERDFEPELMNESGAIVSANQAIIENPAGRSEPSGSAPRSSSRPSVTRRSSPLPPASLRFEAAAAPEPIAEPAPPAPDGPWLEIAPPSTPSRGAEGRSSLRSGIFSNQAIEFSPSLPEDRMSYATPRIQIGEEEKAQTGFNVAPGEPLGRAQRLPSSEPWPSETKADKAVPGYFDSEPPADAVQVASSETLAAVEPYSTFSLHVSDVSFKLARAALAKGEWPDASQVRIEEFVNALDYLDPLPAASEHVACRMEQVLHPFMMNRQLLRVSLRTAATGRSSSTPLRLTLLLDNSGSMERPDRRQTVRRAFEALASQLGPADQVTLIVFANKPRLVADRINGSQAGELVQRLDQLPIEGGTNLELALTLATEKAIEQHDAKSQNRIVLFTDGAVNLGDADPDRLSQLVTHMRESDIAFDTAGISALDLNDEVLETLTRKGDGRYYLLDSSESVDEGFAQQIAGALRPSAKNVKVQIEFNPQRVERYKLLGFEKHLLKQEDFRNDAVDAAELSAAEAGVAMYQFQSKPDGFGDVGTIYVRFRDLDSNRMIEQRWPIPYEPVAPAIAQSPPTIRLATAAAMLASKLRGDSAAENIDLKVIAAAINDLPSPMNQMTRVGELRSMIESARQIAGEPQP